MGVQPCFLHGYSNLDTGYTGIQHVEGNVGSAIGKRRLRGVGKNGQNSSVSDLQSDIFTAHEVLAAQQ